MGIPYANAKAVNQVFEREQRTDKKHSQINPTHTSSIEEVSSDIILDNNGSSCYTDHNNRKLQAREHASVQPKIVQKFQDRQTQGRSFEKGEQSEWLGSKYFSAKELKNYSWKKEDEKTLQRTGIAPIIQIGSRKKRCVLPKHSPETTSLRESLGTTNQRDGIHFPGSESVPLPSNLVVSISNYNQKIGGPITLVMQATQHSNPIAQQTTQAFDPVFWQSESFKPANVWTRNDPNGTTSPLQCTMTQKLVNLGNQYYPFP